MEEISEILQDTSLSELLYGWWHNDRTLGLNFSLGTGTGPRRQSRALPNALTETMDELFNEAIRYFPGFETADLEAIKDSGEEDIESV